MAKYLGKTGLTLLWGKVKDHVSAEAAKKQDALVSGTNIKTLNGESLLGGGNITIDLSLYKVVDELPTTGIDVNKIYLVKSTESGENNVYIEYMYVNSAWEKIGEFKSDIDLSAYAKTADVEEALAAKADASDTYTKTEVDAKDTALKATATTTTDGMMSSTDKTNLEACVETKLSATEKEWVASQLFNKLFVGSISASPSSKTYEGSDYDVTFTLTTKYDGELVDVDAVPSGWTKTATGTYTKTATATSSTGSSIGSGNVTVTYQGNSKSIGGASCSNVKDSYILLSTASALTTADLDGIATNGTKLNSGNSVTGNKTIDVTVDSSYVYFVISNTSSLKNVQQLGLDYLSDKAGVSLSRTNYGTYKVYRSANAMAVGSQSVTIS